MAAVLTTGSLCGVTAQQDADFYGALVGEGAHVLEIGSQMQPSIVDKETVRIADGILIYQGRRIQIDGTDVDDFTIPTGTAATYYIGYKIYNDDGEDKIEHFCSTTSPATSSKLRDGATEVYAVLAQVVTSADAITSVTRLPDVAKIVRNRLADKMKGATSSSNGERGLVPEPAKGDQAKTLMGDGTWRGIPLQTFWAQNKTAVKVTVPANGTAKGEFDVSNTSNLTLSNFGSNYEPVFVIVPSTGNKDVLCFDCGMSNNIAYANLRNISSSSTTAALTFRFMFRRKANT